MSNITTVAAKGIPLTLSEVDQNFINLNNDKVESSLLAAPNGVATLGSDSKVPSTQLKTFSPTNPGIVPSSPGGTDSYLRADGTWATITGGGTGLYGNVDGGNSSSIYGGMPVIDCGGA